MDLGDILHDISQTTDKADAARDQSSQTHRLKGEWQLPGLGKRASRQNSSAGPHE